MSASPMRGSSLGVIKVTPFIPEPVTPFAPESKPEEAIPSKDATHSSLVTKLVSIRTLLTLVVLIIMISMGVGLIILSYNTQRSIVYDLSKRLQQAATMRIITSMEDTFSSAQLDLEMTKTWFLEMPLLADQFPPANHDFVVVPYFNYLDRMYDVVKKRPAGSQMQMIFRDGRIMGVESYANSKPDVYWCDLYNKTYVEAGWGLSLNNTVTRANFSESNKVFGFNYTLATNDWRIFGDPAVRDFLQTCDSPAYWFDLSFFAGGGLNLLKYPAYMPMCNSSGTLLGYIDIAIGVNSLSDTLADITTSLKGKIVIIDSTGQLVASSTHTNIFNISAGKAAPRMRVNTTEDVWIRQVVDKLKGNLNDQTRKVNLNGTEYFLSVSQYNKTGRPFIVVSILEESQFLGQTKAFQKTGISAAAGLAVAGLLIVFFFVYFITKPLFALAVDMHKMSQLDFDFQTRSTPRLFEVGKLYHAFNSMYVGLKSFKLFVPSSVISSIIKSETEAQCKLEPGNVTIMFQDIQDFTSMTEKMDPATLASLMGEYMESMTEVLTKNHGTIDKYIGDSIMTLFNAPDKVAQHPVAAAVAAVECITVLKEKNRIWKTKYGAELKTRFGIHTGDVLVGNMGSVHRMNYTAIGDSVNFASRLEGVNKHFGTNLIVSKAVLSALPPGKFVTRKLAKVRVSGKQAVTPIYEVCQDVQPSTIRVFQFYKQALHSFKKKEFQQAEDLLDQALALQPEDPPSLRLLARVEEVKVLNPLPPYWSYIEDLSK